MPSSTAARVASQSGLQLRVQCRIFTCFPFQLYAKVAATVVAQTLAIGFSGQLKQHLKQNQRSVAEHKARRQLKCPQVEGQNGLFCNHGFNQLSAICLLD